MKKNLHSYSEEFHLSGTFETTSIEKEMEKEEKQNRQKWLTEEGRKTCVHQSVRTLQLRQIGQILVKIQLFLKKHSYTSYASRCFSGLLHEPNCVSLTKFICNFESLSFLQGSHILGPITRNEKVPSS